MMDSDEQSTQSLRDLIPGLEAVEVRASYIRESSYCLVELF